MADRPLPRRISSNKPIAGRAHVDYFVRPVTNLDELRSTLQPHRAYAAYALGQLQPQLFARSEWWLAHGAQGQALVLHSKGGLGHALFALGATDALQAVLQLHPGPRHTFLSCQVQHLETMLRYYHLPDQQSMMRMLVDSETLQPAEGNTRSLTGRDVHTINRLYRSEGTPAFYSAENIDAAVYYGTYEGGSLVAVAGTHVVSPEEGIAVLGNVFTHPGFRAQGLGALVTSAVTRHLLTSCREVVLSVDPRNVAAVAAYRRLGYRDVGRLIEGAAVRRDLGVGAFLRRRLAALRGRRYDAELVSIPS